MGVSVRAIYAYYKKFGYKTVVMGASFRTAEEVLALAGCDKLTISPAIIEQLKGKHGVVKRLLDPEASKTDASITKADANLTESQFRQLLNEDPMATEKLSEGIRGFAKDLEKLKDLIRNRLGAASGAHDNVLKSTA